MNVTFRGRKVSIENVNSYGNDPVDAFVEEAVWLDTSLELNDAEIEALNEDDEAREAIEEIWREYQIGRAEDAADAARDNAADGE